MPITAGYALLMGTLAAGLLLQRRERTVAAARRAEPGTAAPGWPAWLRLIRHLATTFVGGYLVLMAVVVAYYFGVARVGGNFLESAVTGCALLLGLSVPLFLAASWLADWRDRRRASRGRHPPASGPPRAKLNTCCKRPLGRLCDTSTSSRDGARSGRGGRPSGP